MWLHNTVSDIIKNRFPASDSIAGDWLIQICSILIENTKTHTISQIKKKGILGYYIVLCIRANVLKVLIFSIQWDKWGRDILKRHEILELPIKCTQNICKVNINVKRVNLC